MLFMTNIDLDFILTCLGFPEMYVYCGYKVSSLQVDIPPGRSSPGRVAGVKCVRMSTV